MKLINKRKDTGCYENMIRDERQADTKDLTSSSKVLRVLGPNLTDAISFIQEIIKSREKEKEENKNKD